MPQPLPMVFTDGTGWRHLVVDQVDNDTYHTGLDIVIGGEHGSVMGKSIIAPEDGAFSIMAETPLKQIELPNHDILDLSVGFNTPTDPDTTGHNPFNYGEHGVVGVLLTSPQHPREGRIYFYLHQGQPAEWEINNTVSELEARFRSVYTGDPRGTTLPRIRSEQGATTWVPVSAGEWIGQAGNHGVSGGPHVHLEVLEYFEWTSDGQPLGRWRRVDPHSVFHEDLPFQDTTQGVEAALVARFTDPGHGNEPDVTKARENAGNYFRPWTLGEGQ